MTPPKSEQETKTTSSAESAIRRIQFPYSRYVSLLGVLTLLLSFTAVCLPRSTSFFTTLPSQQTSLDKPQHPLLIPIAASPKWTLLWLCLGTGVCQVWWVGWMRHWWAGYPRLGFNAGDDSRLSASRQNKFLALRNACVNTLLMSLLYHIIIIAFGAPIISHLVETLLLSLLLSLLTAFAASYTISLPILSPFFWNHTGPISLEWLSVIRLFGQRRVETALERGLVFPIVSTFIGSWLGSFAIALDWDRPWQSWPLTPAYGALAGYLLGLWSSFIVNVIVFFAGEDMVQHQQSAAPTSSSPSKRKGIKSKLE